MCKNDVKGVVYMRLSVTLKGMLEQYVVEQSKITGISQSQTLVNLAMQGLEYKEGLNSMKVLAKALEEQSKN